MKLIDERRTYQIPVADAIVILKTENGKVCEANVQKGNWESLWLGEMHLRRLPYINKALEIFNQENNQPTSQEAGK